MDIALSWKRISEWHEKNTPPGKFTLNSGASALAIGTFEQLIGESLPDDFCESLSIHDGGDFWIAHFGELLSLNSIKRNWHHYRKWQASGEFAVEGESIWTPRDISGPIKPIFWNPKRVFVTDNGGGDHVALDLDPPPEGTYGQILKHSHEVGPMTCLAGTWKEFLASFADGLEAGEYVYLESEGMVAPPGMYD